MKFAQLIEYNKINIFFSKIMHKRGKGLVPVLFLFFKKALYEAKASGWLYKLNKL